MHAWGLVHGPAWGCAHGRAFSHLGQGGTAARVVDDVCDNTLDVVVALRIVQHAVLGGPLAVGVVGLEDGPTTLTLGPDNTTHLQEGIGRNTITNWLPPPVNAPLLQCLSCCADARAALFSLAADRR